MKKSILIVDDSSYYRSRGAEVVSRAGYEYYFAENGEQAVRMYRRIKPDFVTMDICMPIMDGLEATKEICTKFPGAKVLICSSVGHVPVYKRQAFANGACGVLPKEYDLDDLDKLIVKRYMQLSKDKRKVIKEYLQSIFTNEKDT